MSKATRTVREEVYRCQFCEAETPAKRWKQDKCPVCGRAYDVLLAQDSEE